MNNYQMPWQKRDRNMEKYVANQLVGSRILLGGLNKEELNGAEGKLVGFHDESDRWMVEMKEGGKSLRVKFENLRFIKEEGDDFEGVPSDTGGENAPKVFDTFNQRKAYDDLTEDEKATIDAMTVVMQHSKWEPSASVKKDVQVSLVGPVARP